MSISSVGSVFAGSTSSLEAWLQRQQQDALRKQESENVKLLTAPTLDSQQSSGSQNLASTQSSAANNQSTSATSKSTTANTALTVATRQQGNYRNISDASASSNTPLTNPLAALSAQYDILAQLSANQNTKLSTAT